MFPLHDRTRRWICRTGFVLGAVLPTMAVIAWSAAIHTVAYKELVRDRLKAALRLDVRFDEVSYPRPGVTLLSALELVDPETGDTLLSTRLLEISGSEQTLTLIASQPEINAERLDRLWPLVTQCLQHDAKASQTVVRVATAELTLRWPQGVQTLVDCDARIETIDAGRAATASFRIAGADSGEPARVCVLRSASDEGSTSLNIDTGGTPLPCSLWGAIEHRENWLGPNSSFRGSAWMEETSAGYQAELAGQFDQVDLQTAISDHFPHRFTGTAAVTLERAIVRDGRLEEAVGAIHAGPGNVGRSFLRSAAKSLRMQTVGALDPEIEVCGYEELAAAFTLDAKGLLIHGQCEGEPGTIFRTATGPLLSESKDGSLPVSALVQSLVPDSRVQVPATRQTDWLLRSLPLPDAQPSDPEAMPHARLRGGPNLH